jgi:hypothetical protein
MKFLLLLSLLVVGCAAGKKKKSRPLAAIAKEVSELKSGQQGLSNKLEEEFGNAKDLIGNEISELKDLLSKGLLKLEERIDSIQGKCCKQDECEKEEEEQGVWNLAMNINPADGHIFGYLVGKQNLNVFEYRC